MGFADTLTAVARTAGGAVAAFRAGLVDQRGPAGAVEQRAANITYAPSTTYLSTRAGASLALDAETRGYACSAVAYRCVHAIATNGASVDLQVNNPAGDVIAGHWVSELFNKRPNEAMSAVVFKYLALSQLELGGQAFVWLDRGDGETPLAEPRAMYLLYGNVRPVVDTTSGSTSPAPAAVIGYQATAPDGTVLYLLPDEVLWLRYPHPTRPLEVMAPWRAAMHAVDMDAHAREWQSASYRNGARPGGVLYLGDMDEATYAKTLASFKAGVEGPRNAGKHLLVATPPGAASSSQPEYMRLGLSPAEMDYLESRTANADEVMLAFGVPRDYLAGGTTYENRSAAKATLWSDTIKPKLVMISSEVDRTLLPSPAEDAEWDLSDVAALQDSQDSVANRIRSGTYADIYMIDEARAEVGLDPLPGGLGQNTLTPYRAQFAAEAGAAASGGERAWDAVWPTRPVVAPAPAVPVLPPVDARRGPTAREIEDAYDELEAAGVREVRRLAREMQTHVLRDFDRLVKKPQRFAAWREELHTAAVALAREGALTLDVPDDDATHPLCSTALEVPRWSVDGATPETYGVRIRLSEIFDPKRWARRTRELLAGWLERVWKRGGESITPGFELDPIVIEEMNIRLTDLADQVTETTRQILQARLLQAGVEAGESVPELRARIQQVFRDMADWRADRIARTETVGAYSSAAVLEAQRRGATHKTWHSTHDHRTRPTHRAADGERTIIDGRFRLTQSRWPADPSAPANQSIQCFPADTAVQFGSIDRAYRRWYEGDLVELVTAQGKKLSGTPNHPVLTHRGWVPLGQLEEGDKLVTHRAKLESSRGQHVDAAPAPIGEVFDALDVAGDLVRVRGVGVDFHGDGGNGEVDVVSADRLLRDRGVAAPGELGADLPFVPSDAGAVRPALGGEGTADHLLFAAGRAADGGVRGGGEAGAFLRGRVGHAGEHGGRPVPGGDTRAGEVGVQGPAADAQAGGDRLLGLPGQVTADEVVGVVRLPASADGQLASADLVNAVADEVAPQRAAGDAEFGSEIELGFPGEVATDKVVVVRRLPTWSGHVFNLQTGSGTYSANGIVVHNCRCYLTFEYEESQ